ncbi:ATP-dependent Clp protease proteolytic subunit [Candidatus Uhrbacteria bacterium]|nr:ATP-dependent Clp protease proteolytic subunit [Candidatus Uhrbacteria bacterium]
MESRADERVVYLVGEIDKNVSGAVIANLLALDQRSHDPIRLFIKTNGGYWEEAALISDMILRHIKSPVITIAIEASSSGFSVLVSGNIRLAFEKAKFVVHDAYEEFTAADVGKHWTEKEHRHEADDLSRINRLDLRRCTGRRTTHMVKCKLNAKQLAKKVAEAKDGEYKFGAAEAHDMGFVDAVIKSVDAIPFYEQKLKMSYLSKKGKK